MTVVLLTDDLMVASRIEGAARRSGVALKTCSDIETTATYCREHPVEQLIVDLSSRTGGIAAIIERLSTAAAERPPIIAFGPHVHDKLLAAAAAAGCEEVVSRGQFFAGLDATFARLSQATARPVPGDQDPSPGG
jgi:DNA-binding response OmpR family regulator